MVVFAALWWHSQEPQGTLSKPDHTEDAVLYTQVLTVLIMHQCFQLAGSSSFQSTVVRRPSHQHVVFRWAAFGLHSHHPHRVPMSLCCPRAVQVYEAHTLFTCRGTNRNVIHFIIQEQHEPVLSIYWREISSHLIFLVYTHRYGRYSFLMWGNSKWE